MIINSGIIRNQSPKIDNISFILANCNRFNIDDLTMIFKHILSLFVLIMLIIVSIYLLLFQKAIVYGSSMSPGLNNGDHILIEPWSYWLSKVHRGDIVVLQDPLDPSTNYIKRVIGLPSDTIEFINGYIWINGNQLSEPYAIKDTLNRHTEYVKNDHYFVLGDNRPCSLDSREFGQVPINYLCGRVDLRIRPYVGLLQ